MLSASFLEQSGAVVLVFYWQKKPHMFLISLRITKANKLTCLLQEKRTTAGLGSGLNESNLASESFSSCIKAHCHCLAKKLDIFVNCIV